MLFSFWKGWPTYSMRDAKGVYLASERTVSVFLEVDDWQAIQISYDGKADKIENASWINKLNGVNLKMVFREKSDVLLTVPQTKPGAVKKGTAIQPRIAARQKR